eukprot:jgi/Tetstr1/431369/TSEL_021060.t1
MSRLLAFSTLYQQLLLCCLTLRNRVSQWVSSSWMYMGLVGYANRFALGEMVADARHGLASQQERHEEEDARVPLPAPVAADIMDTAMELRRTLV